MKKITITTIVATILIGIAAISVIPAEAHGPPHIHEILDALNDILAAVSGTSTEVSNIEAKLDNPNFGLEEIKDEVSNIETTVNNNLDATVSSRASQTSVDNLQTTANAIKAKTDNLPTDPADNSEVLAAISALSLSGGGYVPFKSLNPSGGACDVDDGAGGSIHNVIIDGTTNFIVTSVVIQASGINHADDSIEVDGIIVDVEQYLTRSKDVTGIQGAPLGFEVLGTPRQLDGGVLPQTIAAIGAGADDIKIAVLCNAEAGTGADITIGTFGIMVAGWKMPSDTITVTYS